MSIRSKRDVKRVLSAFSTHANYDPVGGKYFLVVPDSHQNGIVTFMYYPESKHWTMHRKGETYWDINEIALTENKTEQWFWNLRKEFNTVLKKK